MTTKSQDFSSSTSLTDNFTQSNPGTGTFDWINNVGLNGSGAISVSLGSDQIWTTKQGYTISDSGTYSVAAFFQSSANAGYGALGLSTQSQDSNTGNFGAPAGSHVGIFFHGGGGGFLSNGPINNLGGATNFNSPITWNNGGILPNGSWYQAIFTVVAQGNNKFDLNIKIYNATSAGIVGSLVTEHSLTDDGFNPTRVGPAVINASVSGASTLHTFFSAQGSRMTAIDNFVIDLDGDTLLLEPGPPAIDLNGSSDTSHNEVTFTEVAGPDDGSAAVFFTSGASNVGDLDSPNLNNLKISVPIASIASGDQLVVTGTSIDITDNSSTAEISSFSTYFNYAIGENSGIRTITFTSLSGTGAGAAPAPIAAYEALLDSITFNNTSDAPATSSSTRIFSVTAADASSTSAVAIFTVNLVNAPPSITSATYDAGTNVLTVTGTNMTTTVGALNDIDVSKLTLTGQDGATYTLTSSNVEISSATQFSVTLNATDQLNVEGLLNKSGTSSVSATTYNIAAAANWNPAQSGNADLTGNGITVSLPSSGGGGGGSSGGGGTTTSIVDGTTIKTTTQPNGTVIINVPVVQLSRQDDPGSLFGEYADIPVTTDTQDNLLLTVSLPVGSGLTTTDRVPLLDPAQAETDILTVLTHISGLSRDTINDLTEKAQQFLTQLPDGNLLSIHNVSPYVAGNQPPARPIIISHSATDTISNMVVIDDRQLPPGTVIQLDNIAFASIIGAARVVGGSGQNFAVGDDQNQFIVLGSDDDILFGSGGEDTVGSLGGNDQTSGDAGNDTVYGGTGADVLNGGTGNDRLNGGLGFDSAIQPGQFSGYQIAIQGDTVTLAQNDGEIETLTDVELIRFADGPNLAIAYSEAEAVAHHLARTWLERDLTTAEGNAVQTWAGATIQDILAAFRNLPEATPFLNKIDDELLTGWDIDPTIIRIEAIRDFNGVEQNDQGYLPLGLAMSADGSAGYDVLRMPGGRSNVHLEFSGDRLELTQLSDGAMLSLKNAEMIAFDSGDTVVIAHDETEAILARLVHSFFDRDVTQEEWQSGREALAAQVNPDIILNWLQQHAELQALSDTDFIQTIYRQTLGRSATEQELDVHVFRLSNDAINRDWLAVEVAQSAEAATHLVGSVMLQQEWI